MKTERELKEAGLRASTEALATHVQQSAPRYTAFDDTDVRAVTEAYVAMLRVIAAKHGAVAELEHAKQYINRANHG